VTDIQQPNQGHKRHERSIESVDKFCREMVGLMHLQLDLQGKEEEGVIRINLSGPDRTILLSNAASMLNSMEFLLNKIFRGDKEETPGIVLDSDHYRQHREAELVLLAQMASTKVIAMRKPLELQPMTPRERRIVHLALVGIEGVHSKSDGEGENRSVTIYPS
jgi:spoIIIJ-associated protein